MTGNSNPAFLHSYPSQQFSNIPGILPQNSSNRSMPSIFSQLPPNFRQITGFNTVSGIPFSNNIFHTAQSGIVNRNLPPPSLTLLSTSSTFAPTSAAKRISGRNESQFDIRRTASGINTPESNASRQTQAIEPTKRRASASRRLATIPEKRFGSLEIRKHKSYSPTFYSMRCKKHMKRRPIVIAVPKKCVKGNEDFQNLTDSIQIYEQNCDTAEDENDDDDVCETPVPAPRGRRQRKSEIIYANVSPSLSKCDSIMEESNSSEDAIKTDIETQAQVHASNDADNLNNDADETPDNCVDVVDGHDENNQNLSRDALTDAAVNTKNAINKTDHSPKLVAVSPKQAPKIAISSHALKNSPTLKVSPNFVKPKTESPKGALSLQIKAKIKASPLQSPADNPNKSILSDTKDNKDEHKANEQFPEIPEMPILNTQTKRTPNITNASSKNAFYTLTTPHFKQLNTVIPPQYSATIPHQKHAKLIPKALFQEQLPKSKSFSSKAKQKKHNFQIPLQKCHSFKFQTAESYFQPIKNIHEENLMRNGYVTDYPESSYRARHHKRDKPKHKTKGPLVLRRPGDYQENVHFQENMQNSVQLQYPQPMPGVGAATNKPNGVVYADLDMPNSNSKKGAFDSSSSKSKSQKSKPKTEYATLKFNDVGQEIDV
ncbi:hypothetical protein NQ318_019352 [Aromia moschata]|uniref:Uncharacterized protein n=1 Tax=Aromia moschata TaxID=1265417 RepID=A0AAV8YCV9_9CUCU|nr:hypothetical protein NQ318_019352 [Aromia moschata]